MDLRLAFQQDKEKYLNLSLKEKRSEYLCKSKYVTLENIQPWSKYATKIRPIQTKLASQWFQSGIFSKYDRKGQPDETNLTNQSYQTEYSKQKELNEKVSIFLGDITALEIDVIVNAANEFLQAGGGVDGAIHKAAGPTLMNECISLKGCPAGDAKITGGYKLPAKYVIQTVGPFGENSKLLKSCYERSLTLAKEHGLRTIAFPCISTGVNRYPNESAAHVALETVRLFLSKYESSFDQVIFCLFLSEDFYIYEALMKEYFPV